MCDRGLILYLQKFAVILRNLEAEKSSIQREVQPLLSQKPLDPTASTVLQKLTTANNKIDDLTALSDLYKKKWEENKHTNLCSEVLSACDGRLWCLFLSFLRTTAAMYLEKQAKKVDNMVSGFEDQLAVDTVLVNESNNIKTHSKQFQVESIWC